MGKKQILSGIGEDSDKSKIFIKNNVTLEIIRTTNFIRFWRRSGLTEVYCISTAEKVSPVCIKEKNMPDPVQLRRPHSARNSAIMERIYRSHAQKTSDVTPSVYIL